MRQFFSWRVWAAFGAVIALAVLWWAIEPRDITVSGLAGAGTHDVQFVSLVYQVEPSANFGVSNGRVVGAADLVLDASRVVHIVPGTPGEVACADLTTVGRCVVLADLLGDAVVWFTLQPVQTGFKVFAPPIVELLDDGIARLRNGWLVPYAGAVDRKCGEVETDSLTQFIREQGPTSQTVIDIASQRITQVVCAGQIVDPSTTTTVAPVIIDPGPGDPVGETIPVDVAPTETVLG